MSILKFRQKFLTTEYHLSTYENAAFSAIMVAICLLISHSWQSGLAAAAFITGAQSVTGINRQGSFRIRLGIAGKATIILSAAAVLGVVAAGPFLPLSIVTGIVMAFCFAWCRQVFPLNWPDVIIPSAVLFYMNFAEDNIGVTAMGAVLGFACELLLGMIMFIKKKYFPKKNFVAENEVFPTPPAEPDRLICGLRSYLFLYAVELSLLLAVGFILIRYTGYPHAYWMPLTCVMVLKVGRRGTVRRVLERTTGTLIGCLLGSILLYLELSFWLNALAMVVCIFVWLCYLRKRYAVGTIFINTFVLLSLGNSLPFSPGIVLERMIFTVMAGALVLCSSFLFLSRKRLLK